MRPITVALLLALAATGAAAQDDKLPNYASSAALTLHGGGGLQRLVLPLAVLQASRSAGWADVRVFNAAGEPVPTAWAGTPAGAAAPPRRVPLPQFAWPGGAGADAVAAPPALKIRLRADGAVLDVQSRGTAAAPAADGGAWLLDLQPLGRERPVALVLQWPAAPQGLVRRATVQASSDAQAWQTVGAATLVDVAHPAGGSAVQQPRIALQGLGAEHRYLRLVVAGGGLSLQAVQAELDPVTPEPVLASVRLPLQPDGERRWRLDAGATLPVQRLLLHLAEDNTVAPLQLLRREAGGEWQAVAGFTAYRLQRDGQLLEAPPLPVAAPATRDWRLQLDARVTPPGAAPEATLWWRAPQLVLAPRGAGPFTLAVGRERSPATSLPLDTLVPGYQAGDEFSLPEATLGALATQHSRPPGLAERVQQSGPAERRQWLLWAMLALAVATLGGLAWRLSGELRRGGAPPPGPPPPSPPPQAPPA